MAHLKVPRPLTPAKLPRFSRNQTPTGDNDHITSPQVAVSHFLSHTGCLESPVPVGDETVEAMSAILGYARVSTTGQDDLTLARRQVTAQDCRRPAFFPTYHAETLAA